MQKTLSLFAVLLTAFIAGCSDQNNSSEITTDSAPATVSKAAIASAHPLATEAGMKILDQGGNAFDAAVAVAASLGVVEPYSAGIGGGGFWLLYEAGKDQYTFVDAREKAPSAAHRDMYLTADGSVDRDKAVNGPLAAGIPGQAAAFAHLSEKYGRLPLAQSLQASIDQSANGFPVDPHYRKLMSFRLDAVKRYKNSAGIFLENDQIPAEGYVIKQPDLAITLKQLADNGFDGFYRGPVAERLVKGVQAAGGIWSVEDLASYSVVERAPIITEYQGHKIISAPPPSSGGIAIASILNILNNFDLSKYSKTDQVHLISEAMRRAYKDRAEYLGDPDFVDVPVDALISAERANNYAKSIDVAKATPSLELKGPKNLNEGFHTTHLSVIDRQGNRVSATLSINLPFGSAFTVPDTGVLLNNEMDDFSAKPGEPNAYGLVGNEANAIAANKRPLSSMTPSMVESSDQVAIIGTPGGSRIITMVLLGMLEHFDGKPVEDWVGRPRFHHQYLPDHIQHEPDTFTAEEISALEAKGHQLKSVSRQYGNMQAILLDKKQNSVTAASDPRGIGTSIVR